MKQKKCLLIEKLIEEGWFYDEKEAIPWIMSRQVLVNDQPAMSSKEKIAADSVIRIKGYHKKKYVTRSGLKLEKALEIFDVAAKDKICIDIGASEGGFTDCLLQNNAAKVYSVDVAYGILNWKIRNNEKVVVLERTNARYLSEEQVKDKCDIVTIDVAFISITKILPGVKKLLKDDGKIVALYKPQFELDKQYHGKNGNVESIEAIAEAMNSAISFLGEEGIYIRKCGYSPICGNNGNIEFLLYGDIEGESKSVVDPHTVSAVILEAFHKLSRAVVRQDG